MDFIINTNLINKSPIKIRKQSFEIIDGKLNPMILKDKKISFIGLSGGQASGKTKIANYCKKNVPNILIIDEKDFFKVEYKDKSLNDEDIFEYPKKRKKLYTQLTNPLYYDYEKLYDCLKKLSNGEKIKIPHYDYDNYTYIDNYLEIDPNKINLVIVQGYFIYKNANIRDLLDFKLYIEVDDDTRFSRLVLKESKFLDNKPNAFKEFFEIYVKYIKESFEKHIRNYKKYANLMLANFEMNEEHEIDHGDETLEFLVANLKNLEKKKA